MIKDRLMTWVGVELWHLPEWYSRAEIAQKCGCSKSPSLLKELRGLVEEQVLVSRLDTDGRNRPVILYKISEGYRALQLEDAKHYGE